MSVRRFPNSLPVPSAPGYGFQPFDQNVRTDMEVGVARVRRTGKTRLHRGSMLRRFSDAEMFNFRLWHDDQPVSLVGSSDDLTAWTLNNASASGSPIGPDLVAVTKLVENSATAEHKATFSLGTGINDNAVIWATVALKDFGRSQARWIMTDKGGATNALVVDLSAGTCTTTGTAIALALESLGSGWTRVTGLFNAGTGASACSLVLKLASGGATSYAGDGTSGMGVANIQARASTGYDLFVPADANGNALGAGAGSAWFCDSIPLGGGMTYAECRYSGPYQDNALDGLIWEVTAPFEVRNA